MDYSGRKQALFEVKHNCLESAYKFQIIRIALGSGVSRLRSSRPEVLTNGSPGLLPPHLHTLCAPLNGPQREHKGQASGLIGSPTLPRTLNELNCGSLHGARQGDARGGWLLALTRRHGIDNGQVKDGKLVIRMEVEDVFQSRLHQASICRVEDTLRFESDIWKEFRFALKCMVMRISHIEDKQRVLCRHDHWWAIAGDPCHLLMPPFVTSHDLASTERRSVMIAHLRTQLRVETASGLQLIVSESPLRRKNASRSSTRGMQRGRPSEWDDLHEGGGRELSKRDVAEMVELGSHYRHPCTGACRHHGTPHDDETIQMASTKAPKKVPGTARRQLLQMCILFKDWTTWMYWENWKIFASQFPDRFQNARGQCCFQILDFLPDVLPGTDTGHPRVDQPQPVPGTGEVGRGFDGYPCYPHTPACNQVYYWH
ncbi:hypothetical protein EDB84DRAFT_1437544 [Lactarius hengduanensis]|nr:hypothetical protein EDB84DRAFT_1437544 [Lactarius hengduanensis]